MAITLRAAVADDLDGIVDAFLSCWTGSYAAVLPATLIASLTNSEARRMWRGALAASAPGEVVVAERSSPQPRLVGVTRWSVTDDPAPSGHIASLYVDPSAQGLGVGARLLEHATEAIAATGARSARLWVFRDNAPAVGFYRRHGWSPDGTTRVEALFGEPEIGLVRRLVER